MTEIFPDFCLSSYRFDLPEALIAQEPAVNRGASRLLVLGRSTGEIQSTIFNDILQFLPKNCLLIANNSRVIPARMHMRRATGGQVEFLLLTPPPLLQPSPAPNYTQPSTFPVEEHTVHNRHVAKHSALSWQTAKAEGLLRSSKKMKAGESIILGPDITVEVRARGDFGRCQIQLYWQGDLLDILARLGSLPLPPYIKRPVGATDTERYQTTYARTDKAGSVAAPTAGLHFTPQLREALIQSGREWAEVTLYVGYGTFSPVRCEDIREHPMHAEYVELPLETVNTIARAKAEGRPVIAVGTTSARVLEGVFATQNSLASKVQGSADSPARDCTLAPHDGWINVFLYPGKAFHVIDGLITNFHLPESSLLMLVSALAGRKRILAAYQRAVAEGFRFFSYGDAMLIV